MKVKQPLEDLFCLNCGEEFEAVKGQTGIYRCPYCNTVSSLEAIRGRKKLNEKK